MTPDQRDMAMALAACVMCPGIGTKRFARQMAERAHYAPDKPITEPQAKYLAEAVIRYRKQIPQQVVLLAHEHLQASAA